MPFLVFSSTKYQPGIFFGMLCGGAGGWRGKATAIIMRGFEVESALEREGTAGERGDADGGAGEGSSGTRRGL